MGAAGARKEAGDRRPFLTRARERIRALLSGGVIAAGVKPPRTDEDWEYEEALYYESVARVFPWPPTVVREQPHDLLVRMLEVAAMRSEVEAAEMRAKQAAAANGH